MCPAPGLPVATVERGAAATPSRAQVKVRGLPSELLPIFVLLVGLGVLTAADASAAGAFAPAPITQRSVADGASASGGEASVQRQRANATGADLVPGGLVDIRAVLGFSDTFRLGRWTPVTVIVSNRGSDLVGMLELRVADGSALLDNLYTTSHRRRLELPRDSRKRFQFTAFLDSVSRPLEIRVTSGGREVASRSIDLRRRFTESRLLLVLSRDADLDYLNDSAEERLRVLYPHPELLPERWQGYDGVAALVLHGVSLERLSERQYEALNKWLASGGILAVSGGPDYSLLRTPRLAELLPGNPLGVVQLADGAALSAALGEPIDASRPFGVNRLIAFRGEALYRVGEIPLVIQEQRGRGRVLFLTFDVGRYPFDRWAGMKRLWLSSLQLPPAQRGAARATESQHESPVLRSVKGQSRYFPGHGTVVLFVALYLGILATVYWLRPPGNTAKRLVPALALATPLLFAACAYLLFGPLLFPRGATAVVLSLIEPFSGSVYAGVELDVGLYANQRHTLQFEYTGLEPVFRPTHEARDAGEAANWVHRRDRVSSVQPEDSRKYVLHTLVGHDVMVYDLEARATETATGLRVHVRNHSGRPIDDAWVVFAASAYPLGSIPAGANLARVFDAGADGRRLENGSWQAIVQTFAASPDRDRPVTESLLERSTRELRETPDLRSDEALLVGFSTSPLRAGGIARAWQRSELTLVLLRLPVKRLAQGLEALGSEP